MSFILDALQRAQKAHDAQSVATAPILAERVEEAPANPQARVLWLTAAVLGLLSVALIAWTMGREAATPTTATPQAARPAGDSAAPATAQSPFARTEQTVRGSVRSLGAEAARAQPATAITAAPGTTARPAGQPDSAAAQAVADADAQGMIAITPSSERRAARTQSQPQAPTAAAPAVDAALPDYDNVLLGGQVNLPNLRLDMHVFHKTPARRFVFINFKKFREGEALDGDTVIEEITAGGAVLNHNGRRFVLRPN